MPGNRALQFRGVGNMLEREYRATPAYQWARELVMNGKEALATLIQIGVEWQAVEKLGVYRLQYADDGVGMTRDQLHDYMGTLGEGSKTVGGPHDNYALGCRMTLLPWNARGVVVISVVDGVAWMVKMMFDQTAFNGVGEYVMEEIDWVDENGVDQRSTVYPPYVNDEEGFDWADCIPDFIRKAGHGTTFILLGNSGTEDTFNGDSARNESIRYLTRKYFNTRFWTLPENVTLQCIEFVNPNDRSLWPKNAADRKGKYQYRGVKGGEDVANYVLKNKVPTLQDAGTVHLDDGTTAHWFLRKDTQVDTGGVGSSSGFIAMLYRGELYGHAFANQDDGDTKVGAGVYRQFGIGSESVRKRVFLILQPPEFEESTGEPGVAPSTSRADLYWMGAGLSGSRSVKPADWSDEMARKMPDAIADAIKAELTTSLEDSSKRDERLRKVMDRFTKRWRAQRARVSGKPDTDTTTEPNAAGTSPREAPDAPVPRRRNTTPKKKKVIGRGRSGPTTIGQPNSGTNPAEMTTVSVGYPEAVWVSANDINEPGMMAAWQKPGGTYKNGAIYLDEDHPVVTGQIEHWQAQYPPVLGAQIEQIVREVYEDAAIAKVSHLHQLTGTVLSTDQRDTMLLNPALTTSLLGLLGEDALISPRLGGLGSKRAKAPTDGTSASDDPAA